MDNKRTNRIHLAASVVPPLALLVSLSYTMMYRAVGLAGRWLTPLFAVIFFIVGYSIMRLQERIFGVTRTDFDIDDGVSEVTRRYVLRRFLILPAIIAAIPGACMVPLVDKEIRRLVNVGELDYYSDNFIAPWLVFAVIVIAAILGASARMKPGNVSITPFYAMFHAVCHVGLFIINIFMEVPSTLPTVLFTAVLIVSVFELNAAFVDNICRKTGDFSGQEKLRETNFNYVKRIVRNFLRVFIVPFLLTAAWSVVWQYLLENALNQPL
ncbi:MAG: hypothetical protein IJC15_05515 [Clostridia bacterium]|nr:hypothetical protein [Clostridia bacterium]